MACSLHSPPIPIDTFQSLPPELIAPIYALVFDTHFCCPKHFANVLRTSKEFYVNNVWRLYDIVSLDDHNCKAFFDGWEGAGGEGSELDIDSWDFATCSQTFQHHNEPDPPTGIIPLNLHSASRKVLLWRYCRSLRLESVTAVRMAALASDRLDTEWRKYRTERSPPDEEDPDYYLYTGFTIPSDTHPLFPSLKRISFALPIMQELYYHPEQIPEASAATGEISIRSAMSALMSRLKRGAAVCMRLPDTTKGYEEIMDEDERRDMLWVERTRFSMVIYDIVALSHCLPSRLVFHGVHAADWKTRVSRTPSFGLDLIHGNDGELRRESERVKMEQVKQWCKGFFRKISDERPIGFPTHVDITSFTSYPVSFGYAAEQHEDVVDGSYKQFQQFLEDLPGYSAWAGDSRGTLTLGPSQMCEICQYEGHA
ncbi:hypothetical protein, variant [Cryptococcus amylolentus CBS 6039]|uniref:Uncharacterized protein n=1 Tax=Cryptococcus amylolentus CBS 6039 TaxID=1295533 RepID=A0A1E3HI94_9TREE|nr:hypothetical protein L202_06337 [Cryptococcus amylolentus CBS 6039]XP_018990781.1 hypothetical protein, variant [Cryptococcus amylolentus CBS 6039]ODN75130.1 hypothetical protein L202_06337 [Cryptococcus amylolentus CBS 6039]ODN75131.1 hypothetical protein, variant [Cryptococcus amylolentus CBS 6039]